MNINYNPCPCESGKKFKFCCLNAIMNGDTAHLETRIAKFPVLCFTNNDFQEYGMAQVVVARQVFDGVYVIGIYLIDLWCLGVKDAGIKVNCTEEQLETIIEEHNKKLETAICSYEYIRSLILGSVNYAASLGIAPHPDWEQAKILIEPHRTYESNIRFGRDGLPFYVAGPHDRNIRNTIAQKVIEAGGDFTIEI